MTKKTSIVCNHCHSDIKTDAEGLGIHFTSLRVARAVGIKEAETHLCTPCAQGYQQAITQILGTPVPPSH